MTAGELSYVFFIQMAAIIATCRVTGWCVHRFLGQPQVVGEMIAGVLLGPSVLGAFSPEISAALFPPESRKVLYVGAQFGVGLYMFLVGMSFDRTELVSNRKSAATVAVAGMAVPFLCAIPLAPWLMQSPGLFSPQLDKWQATLFIGAAIAITAFPMLARIIHEQGIGSTRLGVISLSAGAIGDVGAWVVIAFVLASLGDGFSIAIRALGGGILFVAIVVWVLSPLLARLERVVPAGDAGAEWLLALVLILYLLCAWATDAAGLHAVFGGFLLGTAMPRGDIATFIRKRLEPFTVVFLLPMFFTYSGLVTDLGVITHANLLVATAVVVGVSVLGKGGACYLAARIVGEDHRTAFGVGALMNARGLMELIIINIGLQRGLIKPGLFAILVVMAIVTTLMTTPLFERWGKSQQNRN